MFRKLNADLGLTILIVTHDLGLAEKVNRGGVMISDGKISTEKIRKEMYGHPADSGFLGKQRNPRKNIPCWIRHIACSLAGRFSKRLE